MALSIGLGQALKAPLGMAKPGLKGTQGVVQAAADMAGIKRKRKSSALDAAITAAAGGEGSVPVTGAVGPVARAAGRGFFGY